MSIFSFRFRTGTALPGAHWMSGGRFHSGHMVGQWTISRVIVPGWTGCAGGKEVTEDVSDRCTVESQ